MEWRRFLRERANSKPTRITRSISRSEYDKVSTAFLPRELAQRFFGLPKYNPPVSSLTIIISTPSKRWGRNGLDEISSGYTVTGLKLAKRPNRFLSSRIPSSGRTGASGSSHFGPPTAPNRTASELATISRVSSGRAIPNRSIALPPIVPVRQANVWL